MMERAVGLVSIVGAGPGDLGLLTLKAVDRLGQANTVVYAEGTPEGLYERYAPAAHHIFDRAIGGGALPEITDYMVCHGLRGERLVYLVPGDGCISSRTVELLDLLRQHGVRYELVPGVNSMMASAAYAGIPLPSERQVSISYPPPNTPAIDTAGHLRAERKTVLMEIDPTQLPSFAALLAADGVSADVPCAVIQFGTTDRQRSLVSTVGRLAEAVCDAGWTGRLTCVVGDTVRSDGRGAWFDRRPLWGRRVLVTRATLQSPPLITALREAGAGVSHLPVLEFAAPIDLKPLNDAIHRLSQGQYDWVVFTSANAVGWFHSALRMAALDVRVFGQSRLACVGPATEEALKRLGLVADLIPTEFRGEGLLRDLQRGGPLRGQRILLPRSALARPALPEGLASAGAIVDSVVTYRTISPSIEGTVARKYVESVDTVTFTSPSAVKHLIEALGDDGRDLLRAKTLAVIGPITSRALVKSGLEPAVVAQSFSTSGLVCALEQHALESRVT